MKTFSLFLALALFTGLSGTAWASQKTIFEGYYKVSAGQRHVGYVVHRYSFDEKNKRFFSTYYLRTNKVGGDITESLNAVANDKFQPMAYQFTQTVGSNIRVIDATFKGLAMTAKVSNGQANETITRTFPKGSFLSTFLVYLMLQNGIITDKNYQYFGVAEEDASSQKGQAYISKNMVNVNGMKLFKVSNIFKDSRFFSLINEKGEVYQTQSPVQKISTVLVSQPSEATAGLPVNTQHLKKLFGNIPVGNIHSFPIHGTPLKPQDSQENQTNAASPSSDQPVPIGRPSKNKGQKKGN